MSDVKNQPRKQQGQHNPNQMSEPRRTGSNSSVEPQKKGGAMGYNQQGQKPQHDSQRDQPSR